MRRHVSASSSCSIALQTVTGIRKHGIDITPLVKNAHNLDRRGCDAIEDDPSLHAARAYTDAHIVACLSILRITSWQA
jgi:hypothetical protein